MPHATALAFPEENLIGWERATYAFLVEKERRSGSLALTRISQRRATLRLRGRPFSRRGLGREDFVVGLGALEAYAESLDGLTR